MEYADDPETVSEAKFDDAPGEIDYEYESGPHTPDDGGAHAYQTPRLEGDPTFAAAPALPYSYFDDEGHQHRHEPEVGGAKSSLYPPSHLLQQRHDASPGAWSAPGYFERERKPAAPKMSRSTSHHGSHPYLTPPQTHPERFERRRRRTTKSRYADDDAFEEFGDDDDDDDEAHFDDDDGDDDYVEGRESQVRSRSRSRPQAARSRRNAVALPPVSSHQGRPPVSSHKSCPSHQHQHQQHHQSHASHPSSHRRPFARQLVYDEPLPPVPHPHHGHPQSQHYLPSPHSPYDSPVALSYSQSPHLSHSSHYAHSQHGYREVEYEYPRQPQQSAASSSSLQHHRHQQQQQGRHHESAGPSSYPMFQPSFTAPLPQTQGYTFAPPPPSGHGMLASSSSTMHPHHLTQHHVADTPTSRFAGLRIRRASSVGVLDALPPAHSAHSSASSSGHLAQPFLSVSGSPLLSPAHQLQPSASVAGASASSHHGSPVIGLGLHLGGGGGGGGTDDGSVSVASGSVSTKDGGGALSSTLSPAPPTTGPLHERRLSEVHRTASPVRPSFAFVDGDDFVLPGSGGGAGSASAGTGGGGGGGAAAGGPSSPSASSTFQFPAPTALSAPRKASDLGGLGLPGSTSSAMGPAGQRPSFSSMTTRLLERMEDEQMEQRQEQHAGGLVF